MDISISQDNGIAARIYASNHQAAPAETTTSIFGEDGFTFGDIIDIVNPLQHIPIVNNIYRKMTGDTIAPAMEIAGGALFGGPLGAVTSLASLAFQSYLKSDSIDSGSIDPDSPYQDNQSNEVNRTAIANNAPPLPQSIGIEDYAAGGELETMAISQNKPVYKSVSSSVLNSEYINSHMNPVSSINRAISLNTLTNERVYQPADGIVNLAYKTTESYGDMITSTKTPEESIDIIIGTTSDAG